MVLLPLITLCNRFVNLAAGGRASFSNPMAKSKSIPWKTPAKTVDLVSVGNEDYGVLELPRYRSLTINEAQFIRENTGNLPDTQEMALQLAVDISNAKGVPFQEVFLAMSSGGESAGEYAPQLIKLQKEMALVAPIRNTILATAMLRRLMGSDWTIEQTSEEIPSPLIEELAAFCGKEMNGWIEPLEDNEPVTEETLKND